MKISSIIILLLSVTLHSCKADGSSLEAVVIVETVKKENIDPDVKSLETIQKDNEEYERANNTDIRIGIKGKKEKEDNNVVEEIEPIKVQESSSVDNAVVIQDDKDIFEQIEDESIGVNMESEEMNLPIEEPTDVMIEEKNQVTNVIIEETSIDMPSHDLWNGLLQKHVSSEGAVDYKGFKSDYPKFKEYLELVKRSAPNNAWSRAEKMCYWINAYNAFTVDLIVSNYPVASITDLDGGDPWKVKRIEIQGKSYSLNDIEHVILRPTFKDARIHFAVNCAAKSCPKLSNSAFTPENLESKLESLAKQFVNNNAANQITASSLQLSKIFEWYKEDFVDLVAFIAKYANQPIDTKASVTYNDYNWALND